MALVDSCMVERSQANLAHQLIVALCLLIPLIGIMALALGLTAWLGPLSIFGLDCGGRKVLLAGLSWPTSNPQAQVGLGQ